MKGVGGVRVLRAEPGAIRDLEKLSKNQEVYNFRQIFSIFDNSHETCAIFQTFFESFLEFFAKISSQI